MKQLVIFSFVLLCFVGCSESGPKTNADHFNETQNDTNTPYGNVRDGSGTDNDDGSVTFETDNGDRLNVPVSNTDAGPHYGTPRKLPD